LTDQFHLIGLVGERHFQTAIEHCRPGSLVMVVHEYDNPYDESSLAVFCQGRRLGYLAPDSPVQSAVFDERKGVFAKIASVGPDAGGLLHVVVELAILDRSEASFRVPPHSFYDRMSGFWDDEEPSVAKPSRGGMRMCLTLGAILGVVVLAYHCVHFAGALAHMI